MERDVSRCHCFCKVVSKKCCGNWSWQEDQPIQVSRPFQKLGIDIIDLPLTDSQEVQVGNPGGISTLSSRPGQTKDRYIPNPDHYQGSGHNHTRNQGSYGCYSRIQGPGVNQDRDQGSGGQSHYQGPGQERERYSRGQGPGAKRCFKCNEVGHVMRDCPQVRSHEQLDVE